MRLGLDELAPADLGPIDDLHIVGGDAAADADLLILLQQPVVQRTVGVHLALQNIILDAAIAQIEHLVLQLLDLLLKRGDFLLAAPPRTGS